VGLLEGDTLGIAVGLALGDAVGIRVGLALGIRVGAALGECVGARIGLDDGCWLTGLFEGCTKTPTRFFLGGVSRHFFSKRGSKMKPFGSANATGYR